MLRHDAGLTSSSSRRSPEQTPAASEWPCLSHPSNSPIHAGPQDGTIGDTNSYGHDANLKLVKRSAVNYTPKTTDNGLREIPFRNQVSGI